MQLQILRRTSDPFSDVLLHALPHDVGALIEVKLNRRLGTVQISSTHAAVRTALRGRSGDSGKLVLVVGAGGLG